MRIRINLIFSFILSITFCYGQGANQLNDLLIKSIEKYLTEKRIEQAVFLKRMFLQIFRFQIKSLTTVKFAFGIRVCILNLN